jgi:TQXA domain-containing protein/LPXTG-motif cell wall-anchored protein
MISARKRVAPRLAAAAFAAGVIAAGSLATAGTAVADDAPGSGATATLGSLTTSDTVDVMLPDGREQSIGGGLFSLTAEGGGTLQTYCIDFNTRAINGTEYRETGWGSSTLHDNPDAGKIQWILQNSYPTVDEMTLATNAGVSELSKEQAAAGTQAAIWELSDGVDAVPENDNAEALTDWLLSSAQDVAEPAASLELSPAQVAGQPGQIIGPVTVSTTADSVVVTPDAAAADQGVTIVDANGEYVTEDQAVTDGTELYFSVPADAEDGSASLTATATSQVPVGRAFTGVDPENPTQTMILAGSSDFSVSATASANWAAPGTPSAAINHQVVCAEGGVEVIVDNTGDVPFEFQLNGEQFTVNPGDEPQSVLVPVADGQAYDITIENGLGEGEDWHITGTLDCSTDDDTDADNEPAPASAGGSGGDEQAPAEDNGPDLANTGSSTNPAMIGGIAVALLAVGGGAVFLIRKRGATAGAGAQD